MRVRLQKVIAASGITSRRKAESLIQEGRVTVNGQVVRKLGTCVDPTVDHIKVNGWSLKPPPPDVFVIVHKPAGYLTTLQDPLGRPTIAELIKRVKVRVFPVGRLDYDAEGLVLLTNNGQIAQACLHPRYHVPKTYLVKVSGVLTDEEIEALQEGVELDDGPTAPACVKKSGIALVNSWLEITIYEGRKHQIKRMLEAVGHQVLRLRRIRFGPLWLGDLPAGACRYTTDQEANALRLIGRAVTAGEETPAWKRPYLDRLHNQESSRLCSPLQGTR
ncbi:MAG: rRNA pseudouridine synthase [Nitrospirae bacterium]|nr:MAG: rRNA pseudouridine synthase [Nitrospirota bacterium]